ncbi:MAG: hypothetical protein JNM39_17770 [Bdellovibrionaceae bacterium]|nr:hypothetical protein [Pseudobdellovibrionaceae bacterium]
MLNFRPRKNLDYQTPHEFHYDEELKLIESTKYYTKKRNQRISTTWGDGLIQVYTKMLSPECKAMVLLILSLYLTSKVQDPHPVSGPES